MKIDYQIKYGLNNGYRCSCCSRSWTSDATISLERGGTPEFFYNKKNHLPFPPEFIESIFEAGCREIASCYSGDEFEGDFSIIYDHSNNQIGQTIELEIEIDECVVTSLKDRWKTYETEVKAKHALEKKRRKIKELKDKLLKLESEV